MQVYIYKHENYAKTLHIFLQEMHFWFFVLSIDVSFSHFRLAMSF